MTNKIIISIVNAGDLIPFDGVVIEGCASVDESAQTGYSSPVLLEAVAGRNTAIAGTLVIDGWLKIESPIDARMREREREPELAPKPEQAGSSGQSNNNNNNSEERKALAIIALVAVMALAGFLWLVS